MPIPARLRPYVLPSDTPITPPARSACGWDDLCGWDTDRPHPDMVRPVIVAINDDTYHGVLGRMCIVHYRAVLQARAQRVTVETIYPGTPEWDASEVALEKQRRAGG